MYALFVAPTILNTGSPYKLTHSPNNKTHFQNDANELTMYGDKGVPYHDYFTPSPAAVTLMDSLSSG